MWTIPTNADFGFWIALYQLEKWYEVLIISFGSLIILTQEYFA